VPASPWPDRAPGSGQGRADARRAAPGGQCKRTNIGIALVANPRVLFLDEPTSGLDSYTANEVRRPQRRGPCSPCVTPSPTAEQRSAVLPTASRTHLAFIQQLLKRNPVMTTTCVYGCPARGSAVPGATRRRARRR